MTRVDMKRYYWLEEELDREDLTDEEFDKYNKEINDLQDIINAKRSIEKTLKEAKLREQQEEAELAKILSLTEEEVDKMYEAACIKYQDVNGMSFKQWYTQSLRYYAIDEKHNVHAIARSSNTVEIIEHPTLAQAKLTILRRIKYKFYDHAVRGHNFAWDIDDAISDTRETHE